MTEPVESTQPKTRKKRRGRPRLRPLQGETLVRAAKMELARMVNLSPKTDPINIRRLAERLQFTRQAIYNNDLKALVAEHAELQRKNFSVSVEAAARGRPLEERLVALQKENDALRRQLDGWIARWAGVEYNATLHGIEADVIFAPMSPPGRKRTTPDRKGETHDGSRA